MTKLLANARALLFAAWTFTLAVPLFLMMTIMSPVVMLTDKFRCGAARAALLWVPAFLLEEGAAALWCNVTSVQSRSRGRWEPRAGPACGVAIRSCGGEAARAAQGQGGAIERLAVPHAWLRGRRALGLLDCSWFPVRRGGGVERAQQACVRAGARSWPACVGRGRPGAGRWQFSCVAKQAAAAAAAAAVAAQPQSGRRRCRGPLAAL